MTFREAFPYVIPDGRRFVSLACAGHSIVINGLRCGVRREHLIGERTWMSEYIPYGVVLIAYESRVLEVANQLLDGSADRPAVVRPCPRCRMEFGCVAHLRQHLLEAHR